MANNTPILNELEVVENQYTNKNYEVDISIPEFTCVCPKTGQPDFATIEIRYVPDKYIVELKSLKLYLQQYRDVGMFHEAVTNKILEDFRKSSSPKKIEVLGKFNPRGGINTKIRVRWPE